MKVNIRITSKINNTNNKRNPAENTFLQIFTDYKSNIYIKNDFIIFEVDGNISEENYKNLVSKYTVEQI